VVCSLYANILVYNLVNVYPAMPKINSEGDEEGRTRRGVETNAPVGPSKSAVV
jgi:hypothetical protein